VSGQECRAGSVETIGSQAEPSSVDCD
jgi:hypothetical protein